LFYDIFIIMKLDNLVIEELSRMKSLFGYERGKVVSEQVVSDTPNYGFNNSYNFTTKTPSTSAPPAAEKTLPDVTVKSTLTPRQKNINNAFCNVKNGLIVNAASSHNGTKWNDYVTTYKVTSAEIATSQKKCPNSEVAVKTKTTIKPDPKVMELQKQLKAAGYNLGNSGPNKDGVDGIMGAKTRAAQQQMTQQKGQDALKQINQQGQNVTNQLKQSVLQNSVLSPQQQANAAALKAGQPLPQQQTTQQPTQQNDVVTKEPPTEPGYPGEFKNGWYFDEKSQDWFRAQ
jgi:hypothetical protein